MTKYNEMVPTLRSVIAFNKTADNGNKHYSPEQAVQLSLSTYKEAVRVMIKA